MHALKKLTQCVDTLEN